MRFWIVALALVAVVAAVTADDDGDSEWNELGADTLILKPSGCGTVEFRVKDRLGYRVSLRPIDFPPECSLHGDIGVTTRMYYKGECLVFDEDFKCAEPSTAGIRNGKELCESWSDLDTAPYMQDNSESSMSSMTGEICFSNQRYFLSVSSRCSKAVEFNIQVDARELTEGEEAICDLLPNLVEGVTEAAQSIAWFFVLVAILAIVVKLSIIACCICCPGCPCYYKRNRTTVVVRSVAQHPGQVATGVKYVPLTTTEADGKEGKEGAN